MAEITGAAAYKQLKRDTDYTTPIIEKGTDRLEATFKEQGRLKEAKKAAAAAARAAEQGRIDTARGKVKYNPSLVHIKSSGGSTDDKLRVFSDDVLLPMYKDIKERQRFFANNPTQRDKYAAQAHKIESIVTTFNEHQGRFAEILRAYTKNSELYYDDSFADLTSALEKGDFNLGINETLGLTINTNVRDKDGKLELDKNRKPVTRVSNLADFFNQTFTPHQKIAPDLLYKRGEESIGRVFVTKLGEETKITRDTFNTAGGATVAGEFYDNVLNEREVRGLYIDTFNNGKYIEKEDFTEEQKKEGRARYIEGVKRRYGGRVTKTNVGGGGKETEKEKEYNLFVKRFQKADNLVSNILAKVEGKLPGFTEKESVKKYILKYYDTHNLTLDPKDIEDAVNGMFFWKKKSNNSVEIGGERIALTRESRAEIVKSLVYLEYVPGEFRNVDAFYARMVNVNRDKEISTQQKFNENQEEKVKSTPKSDEAGSNYLKYFNKKTR